MLDHTEGKLVPITDLALENIALFLASVPELCLVIVSAKSIFMAV